jgi:DNA-directed RNA polymerase
MKDQIIETLKKEEKPTTGATKIARLIHRAIKDMAPQAVALRNSVKRLAKRLAKQNKYLRWTTPLGLPVINCYHEPIIEPISVYLRDRNPPRRRVNFVVGDKEEIDAKEAARAAPANFTHSADATHLHFVALACAEANIALVVVHDCFGVLAPRAGRLKEIIPDRFIHLHEDYNMMVDLWSSAQSTLPKKTKLPPMPEIGTLDIRQVNWFAWK